MSKFPTVLIVAGMLAAATPLSAQRGGRQHVPPSQAPADTGGGDARQAVPRGDGARGGARSEPEARRPEPAPRAERQAEPPPAAAVAADEQRRAQGGQRGNRPRGDSPTTGQAVRRPDGGRDGRGISSRPRVYGNNYYYSYPRRSYPYGYGAFGLGYFYYDPYTWYSPGLDYGYGYYPGRPYAYGGRYDYDLGSVRLDIPGPKDAQVLVDGYYAGEVDDFDGTFQALELESGSYKIEIVAPGFEKLALDLRIQPGRKIHYRGELRKLP